jgi:hypothetical protein
MSPAGIKSFHSHFVVLETDDNWYLGRLHVDARRRTVAVYTGLTGKPPVVPFHLIHKITVAEKRDAVTAA